MRSKIWSVIFVLFIFFLFPVNTSAQKIPNPLKTENGFRETKTQFREKLKSVKDERKKKLTERIDGKITNSNQKHAARFEAILDKLSKILERISQKASEVKAKGADTATLEEAIALAQNAIDSAKAEVSKQKEKTYLIQIPENEQGLKGEVGIVVSRFRGELKDVHKKVVEAKQAVMKAEMELAKLAKAK